MTVGKSKLWTALAAGQTIKEKKYWQGKLAGYPDKVAFPYDLEEEAAGTGEAAAVTVTAPGDVSAGLERVGRGNPHAEQVVLTAAVQLQLNKYTGAEDIVVGMPIYRQDKPGDLINTAVALRTGIEPDKNIKNMLMKVRETVMEAVAHQNYPIRELAEKYLDRGEAQNKAGEFPLFDIAVVLENIQDKTYLEALPLNMVFTYRVEESEGGKRLRLQVDYNPARYREDTVKRIVAHNIRLLRAIFSEGGMDEPVKRLGMQSETEKRRILEEYSGIGGVRSIETTVHRLFEEQVRRAPDSVAVVGGARGTGDREEQITNRELNEKANRLAAELRRRGAGAETLIGLMVERSTAMVVGVLGILKAGAAYLPLDPEYPEERIAFMLTDSRARQLVVDKGNSRFGEKAEVDDVLELHTLLNGKTGSIDGKEEPFEESAGTAQTGPANLAYVMYTSGSTGRPRGVMVEHRSVVRLVKDPGYIQIGEDDRILQTGALAFDASTFEIWGALINGSRLYQAPKEVILDTRRLNRRLKDWKITVMWMTSALYNRMSRADIEIFSRLRWLLVGGDVLSPSHIHRVSERYPGLKIVNGYGPTENTTFSTTYRIEHENDKKREKRESIPIGKPITGTAAYILDRYGNPLPEGVVGELAVGGEGLARGYQNNPELTAEKFIENKNISEPPMATVTKLYKTGDLARWLPDGNIEYRGRKDRQVKIRGFRIEMGEIENRIMEHDAVKEVAVIAWNSEAGEKTLAAYVVPQDPGKEIETAEMKEYLSRSLPDYMIPSIIIAIGEIPLTPNKKVDRAALSKQSKPATAPRDDNEAPRTPIEKKLVDIWSQILEIEKHHIGIDDDFFSHGGHSLKATGVTAMIHKELSVEVLLADIFTAPTIRELAKKIEGAGKSVYKSMEKAEEKEYYPQTPQQKRLYILHQMEKNSMSYNMPAVMEVEGELDKNKLQEVFRDLIRRHESLRTSQEQVAGEPVQRIHPAEDIEFAVDNRDNTDGKEDEAELIRNFIRPFRLDRAPLLRVGLIKAGPQSHILMVDMHHIITDGTSQGILVREFLQRYAGREHPPLTHQYRDYAHTLTTESKTEALKKQEQYWLKRYAGEHPVLILPEDKPRPAVRGTGGSHIGFGVGRDEAGELNRVAEEEGASLFMVLQVVTDILLSKLSGQEDIVIGTPVAGRRHADQQNIIGMFVNTLALRNNPAGEKTVREFLREVRRSTLEDFENQEYPFEELVMKANVRRDTARNPLFDVMLALQNQEVGGEEDIMEKKGLRIKPYAFENNTAKFDLNFDVFEAAGRLSCSLEYSTDIYEETTVRRYIGYFKRIIDEITAPGGMDKTISRIEIRSEEEKRQYRQYANGPEKTEDRHITVLDRFRRQQERTPDNIAVEDERALTYRELSRRSDSLAKELRKKGVGPDAIVALKVEPTLEMVMGIWGILKSGGAYLPIDPDTPQERIDYMLKDSNAKVIIKSEARSTDSKHETNPNDQNLNDQNKSSDPVVMNLEDLNFEELDFVSNFDIRASNFSSSNLAYIIYTSGTTGRPKGVMVEHRNLAAYVTAFDEEFNQQPGDRMLQQASYTFDAYVEEQYPIQVKGGRLVIPGRGVIKDTEALCAYIERRQVGMITAAPLLLSQLNRQVKNLDEGEPNPLRSIKVYISGGDRLNAEHVDELIKHGEVYNTYGPTEATVCATYYRCEAGRELPANVPIGKPITGYTVDILDKNHRRMPLGATGELCITGPGVTRGYQNRPELTAEMFIPSNIISHNSPTYRTGDRARWLPCGNLQYQGRQDRQVKIRGYRIELGEVENVLSSLEGIREAAVAAVTDEAGEVSQCGYYVPEERFKGKISVTDLRRQLAARLPDYMIPARYREMERLPVTAGNKIDRKALPGPETDRPQLETEYRAPAGRMESQVADIWKQELNLEEIGVNDNFFDLGGNSLTMLKVNNRLKEELGMDIPVMVMFRYPTVQQLAANLRDTSMTDKGNHKGNYKGNHKGNQAEAAVTQQKKEKHDKSKDRLKTIRKKTQKNKFKK